MFITLTRLFNLPVLEISLIYISRVRNKIFSRLPFKRVEATDEWPISNICRFASAVVLFT